MRDVEMEIEVRLFATMQVYLPKRKGGHSFKMDVAEGGKVANVLAELGVPQDVSTIAVVNGRYADQDSILAPGDVLSVFPPLGGG